MATLNAGSRVVFGATVDLADAETDEEKTYQIVGDLEADIKQGLIAISSPVARALIGKHEGDAITIDAPGGPARVRDRRRPLRRLRRMRRRATLLLPARVALRGPAAAGRVAKALGRADRCRTASRASARSCCAISSCCRAAGRWRR